MLRKNSKRMRRIPTKKIKLQKLQVIQMMPSRKPRKRTHPKNLRTPLRRLEIRFPRRLMMPKKHQVKLQQRTKLELPRSRPLPTKLPRKQRVLSSKLLPKLILLSLQPSKPLVKQPIKLPKPPKLPIKLLIKAKRNQRNPVRKPRRPPLPKPIPIPIESSP